MSFEFHINGNQTTFFILFVLRSCTFGFADYIPKETSDDGRCRLPLSRMDANGQSSCHSRHGRA